MQDDNNKNKELCVYFKLNNLDNSLLSKDYVTQLVLLIDNRLTKKYTFKELLHCFIQDLKVLETSGIRVDDDQLKGSICYICADSLGANEIMDLPMSFGPNVPSK